MFGDVPANSQVKAVLFTLGKYPFFTKRFGLYLQTIGFLFVLRIVSEDQNIICYLSDFFPAD
jgi:hypothetical protein